MDNSFYPDLVLSVVNCVESTMSGLSNKIKNIGELVLQSEFTCDIYANNKEEHDKKFQDRFYYTGGIVKEIDEGYLRILGRVSDVIFTDKGFKLG